ncbi:MAG: DgaE family pyridoxal phosphate-dependent ammonia lyase [Chloroflexi bacterium]|nr:DgaE family pyridoxal phosphate-dependent ammonia lyase [Chloroflexota bacterium]
MTLNATPPADIYADLGVQRVINAGGRLTALGGTTLAPEVAAAMAAAAGQYVRLSDLADRAGVLIAEWTGAEAACVTTGAAAGIALMTAACIAGTDPAAVERLPDVLGERREVVVQIGHLVSFGAPVAQIIRLGGGRAVSAGWANGVTPAHLASAMGPNTAAFLYVQSHHTVHAGMRPLVECLAICRERGVPCLVDAAAEEDLRAYVALGVDAVTYSGGKAFGGPTSGFIAGRRDLIAACRAQERGIGRPMKVGKESVVGLLTALRGYVARDAATVAAEIDRQHRLVAQLAAGLAGVPGLRVTSAADEAGRAIVRAALHVDPASGRTAGQLAEALRAGNPPIYVRGHHAESGTVTIDPRPIDTADAAIIVSRVRAIVGPATT